MPKPNSQSAWLTERSWEVPIVVSLLLSPFVIVVGTLVTWPAVRDLAQGTLSDWETPLTLTILFFALPLFVVTQLVITRIESLDDRYIVYRDLTGRKRAYWAEMPRIRRSPGTLLIQGNRKIWVNLALFKHGEEMASYIEEQVRVQ